MRNLNFLRLGSAFCLSVLLAAGCGQRELTHQKTYPTSGKVTIKGAPAAFVRVVLQPMSKEGVEATATTAQDGTFELRTYSNESADGAVPGEYKVTLEEFDPVKAKAPAGAIPTKLPSSPLDTGLTVTVGSGDNNDLEIAVP